MNMTLLKFNHQPSRALDSFVDDIFNGKFLNSDFFGAHAPVNIRENADGYLLDLAAPGFEKGDFKINLDGQSLTISTEKKTEQKVEHEKQIRREFSYRSFSRSFNLDENVDAEKISAAYENGILKLTLPKKANKQEAVKEIKIA